MTGLTLPVAQVEYPAYWKLEDWCESFRKLLDHLQLDKVRRKKGRLSTHLFLKMVTDQNGIHNSSLHIMIINK